MEKILNEQIPKVEKSVQEINLSDQAIGSKKEPCPKYRNKPGMEGKYLCMYIPKVIFGEGIELRNFQVAAPGFYVYGRRILFVPYQYGLTQ